ncbi:MAG: hypothetical protein HY297_06245, partial [Thaumarchaeota archaeon]|nr:hypothetical protein [Nitrososphaerota archaeon]
MRFRTTSLDHFDLDPRKVILIALAVSACAAWGFGLTAGGALGTAKPGVELVVGAVVLYVVISTPRRLFEVSAMAQSREALVLATTAMACLEVTGSRTRTLLMLRSRETGLAGVLTRVKRGILLGSRPSEAV